MHTYIGTTEPDGLRVVLRDGRPLQLVCLRGHDAADLSYGWGELVVAENGRRRSKSEFREPPKPALAHTEQTALAILYAHLDDQSRVFGLFKQFAIEVVGRIQFEQWFMCSEMLDRWLAGDVIAAIDTTGNFFGGRGRVRRAFVLAG